MSLLATCRHCGQEIKGEPGKWVHLDGGYSACAYPSMESAEPVEEEAKARHTDPDTSHEAAASVRAVTDKQTALYVLFRRVKTLADFEMVAMYTSWAKTNPSVPQQSESGLRTRRSELVDKGFVVDSGRKTVTPTGRRAIVWEVVGKEYL